MPNNPNLLSIRKASEYLDIDKKALGNYVKEGQEIPRQLVGRITKIDKADLDTWKSYFDGTTVILDQDSYYKALRFSLKKFYSGAPRANFATSTQREAGKYLSDHIMGYLGELAFQKFMADKFDVQLRLDDNVDGLVRSQDIVAVSRRRGVENQPAFKISVKTSKMKNVWLIVGKNEVDLQDRRSDYYTFVRVDLPPDHIVRLIRSHPSVEEIHQIIPPEETATKTQICGFVEVGSFSGPTTSIGSQSISPSYVKKSGELRRDWSFIAENL
ncbi:MAG: helix-turn-helix domain-containing protein [Candidatus Omnitrophica bacterium]|nr:helix-turn-helix domain-containing protein [Candidatus Omnitrophota bacterium]